MAASDGEMAVTGDPHVLIVGGSDSSGGAGIVRDVETVAAFGLRACVAVTAVTAQTHRSVERIEPVAPDLIAEQMRAAFAANSIGAVKVGMLGTAPTVKAVAAVLVERMPLPVVLDPVLASTSGATLMTEAGVDALKRLLFPLCTVVTPNLPELALLAGSAQGCDEMEVALQADMLLGCGAVAVLAKGGHGSGGNATDLLVRRDAAALRFRARRVEASMRGTGCMLASAIASGLACGRSLKESVHTAKHFVRGKLLAAA